MIFNIFGFLGDISNKIAQLPNKEKSKKQIKCIKAEHEQKSRTQLKEGKKRSEHISSFHHQNR